MAFEPYLVELDIQPPQGIDLRERVKNALSLGLPEASFRARGACTILANGPTAIEYKPDRLPLAAINGALSLHAPEYWLVCDPQEKQVLDFLRGDLPPHTKYIVASKCHPKVFERLRDYDVTLWHINDEEAFPMLESAGVEVTQTAVSCTLCAMEFLHARGYEKFITYGWDGCYLGGQDHAVPQAHVSTQDKFIIVGPHAFLSTPTWVAEAQDAHLQLSIADYSVKVMGPGYIGDSLRFSGIK